MSREIGAELATGTEYRMARSPGRWYTLYPVIHEDPCISCGQCVRSCPRQAIEMRYGVPHIAYRDCIRCYCCHEMCPAGAISLRRPLLRRVISRFVG
ncbi:MAG: 4Fe-4S binding protein [Methanoculleaceae archaeon]